MRKGKHGVIASNRPLVQRRSELRVLEKWEGMVPGTADAINIFGYFS